MGPRRLSVSDVIASMGNDLVEDGGSSKVEYQGRWVDGVLVVSQLNGAGFHGYSRISMGRYILLVGTYP